MAAEKKSQIKVEGITMIAESMIVESTFVIKIIIIIIKRIRTLFRLKFIPSLLMV